MNLDHQCGSLRETSWAFGLGLLIWLAAASPTLAQTPLGHWLTEDRDAVIAIGRCGNALCGEIAGIPLSGAGEPVPTDYLNRSQCHLTIISGAVPDGSAWRARIIDPRDGGVYRATLRLDQEGRLLVRGYIGIPLFGRTQVWTRFTGPLPVDCRLPDPIPQQVTPSASTGAPPRPPR